MKKAGRVVLGVVGVLGVSAAFATTVFAGPVTETKADCSAANVVLLGGGGENEPASRIHGFIDASRMWGDVTVVSWELASPWKGGPSTAYGVKCTSGKQCNAFAHAFVAAYADSAPVAFCGATEWLRGGAQR